MTGRLILDVTSLLRWTGPPVGIARVEHALATAAMRRPDAVLAFYDASQNAYRALNPAWQEVLIGWAGALDVHFRQPPGPGLRGRLRAMVPGRQPVVAALERVRLTTRRPAVAGLADLAQRAVLAPRRHQFVLYDARGTRLANVPVALAIGEDLLPGPHDTVLAAGSGWMDTGVTTRAALQRRRGFRAATLCYDLIPVTHPHVFQPEIARQFREYWRGILPTTFRVVVNAACIARDLRDFCQTEGLAVPGIAQCPLGYDPATPQSRPAALPGGLRAGRYALFVSTIEPRKGHAMLLRIWRRLLARGLPQRAGFRLVFVGRPGWMVDDVLQALAGPAPLQGTVLHLTRTGEEELNALYRQAAFCLYPSLYEGFGLPVIEAFARGKAVLASSGGALAETVGALSPTLDPLDEAAWERAVAAWIEQPDTVRPVEARIRAGFAHPAWPEAAARILDEVMQ